MATLETETLRVAAVQMESHNCRIHQNLERARAFAEVAAEKGARLVVFPEFMPTGYLFTREIWDAGEPGHGPTVTWLKENSRRLGIWMGTSFLEAQGDDFFNTFVLTSPQGEEEGRVRKQTPALAEAYFFTGDAGSHLIETEIGRIGIGICYENQLAYIPQLMYSNSVDIMLMPHSAPTPSGMPVFTGSFQKRYREALERLAPYYAEMLGVPAVFVNKCGPWRTPVPGVPFVRIDSTFPGLTAIADSDGQVQSRLSDEEGMLVEDVTMDPALKRTERPETHGRWAFRQPLFFELARLMEATGAACYELSRERRRRAGRISGT